MNKKPRRIEVTVKYADGSNTFDIYKPESFTSGNFNWFKDVVAKFNDTDLKQMVYTI